MKRNLADLSDDANIVLNIMVLELLRGAQRATGMSDAETIDHVNPS